MKKENNKRWEPEIVELDNLICLPMITGDKKPVKIQHQETAIPAHLVEMTSGKEQPENANNWECMNNKNRPQT
jgi:hypothetical protein